MKQRIRLDTVKDINNFVSIATAIPHKVFLTDGKEFKVSAKSLLGAMFTVEWDEIYCECDTDISGKIVNYII